jgi:hypothetical protein
MDGIEGKPGQVYVPKITEDGKLIFTIEDDLGTFESIDLADLKGKDGLTYIPEPELEDNNIVFKAEDGSEVKVDFSQFKGEKGDAWKFTKATVSTLDPEDEATVHIVEDPDEDGYILKLGIPAGKRGAKGEKGDQGEQGIKGEKGDTGSVAKFKIAFDEETGFTVLSYSYDDKNWEELGNVGGAPGKSPKLIRLFGTPTTPEDDRIVWGYDGVDVSEWTTLCYLTELKGDQNVVIGCPENFENGEPDHSKIWYDPCDDSLGDYSIGDFLYNAYTYIGGDLSQEDFIKALNNLNNVTGFKIQFASSLESLGEASKDNLNIIYLIPSSSASSNNLYDEYIAINDPKNNDSYILEK